MESNEGQKTGLSLFAKLALAGVALLVMGTLHPLNTFVSPSASTHQAEQIAGFAGVAALVGAVVAKITKK